MYLYRGGKISVYGGTLDVELNQWFLFWIICLFLDKNIFNENVNGKN